MTATATAALATARRLAETYKLLPLPPAVLGLGLVADAASGAAQAGLVHRAASDLRELGADTKAYRLLRALEGR